MNELCLVYLARAKAGLAAFENFLGGLRACPAGVPHDFVIVFKGFAGRQQVDDWLERAREFAPRRLTISDIGFDLRAYGIAARSLQNPWFCFLNSFSTPLVPGWLKRMFTVMRSQSVGLVGATGSAESMYTNALLDRDSTRRCAIAGLGMKLRIALCAHYFAPHPNYHIRTNAFILPGDLMLQIWPGLILTKRGAYLFENGKDSMTARVRRRGLKALVVGRDGLGYEPEQWARSNTFRQGNQENLLVADNQTRLYESATPEMRTKLSRLAWGEWSRA